MSAVISIALWAAVALIISTVLVGIAVAVNRRTRLVDLEKKEVNTTELRRWLNDYEIALGRRIASARTFCSRLSRRSSSGWGSVGGSAGL